MCFCRATEGKKRAVNKEQQSAESKQAIELASR